jgi:hypothetical protein
MPHEMVSGLPLIVLVPPIALLWDGHVHPVDVRTEGFHVRDGVRHVRVRALVATGLDDGDTYMGKRRKPVREHQAGGAAAADHVVKGSVGFA